MSAIDAVEAYLVTRAKSLKKVLSKTLFLIIYVSILYVEYTEIWSGKYIVPLGI